MSLDDGRRDAPIELDPERFRALGHDLVDRIAELLAGMRERPVTGPPLAAARARLGSAPLPEHGEDPAALLADACDLVFSGSTYNSHPRFLAYISGAAAPLGVLGDLLASAANPNVASSAIAPMATAIELQTVRWIAELLGMPASTGGLLVSGGNMANMVGLLAARRARAAWDVRRDGLVAPQARRLRVYASSEAHTWLEKGADLFGLGTAAVRSIGPDREQRIDVGELRATLAADVAAGDQPLCIVGSAGTVSTGAVDPLDELADVAAEHGAWFHVDGAYGAPAVVAAGAPGALAGLRRADSLAVDPHKWLYAPLEAGCALVRDPAVLRDAFSFTPPYYHLSDADVSFHALGPQNSRGFRALKVWLTLRQVGRAGYAEMIGDDMALARLLHELVAAEPQLEARTQGLSITTFRYLPAGLASGDPADRDALNRFNTELLTRMGGTGEALLSNAWVDGDFLLRACVVNFRTSEADMRAVPALALRIGRELEREGEPRRS